MALFYLCARARNVEAVIFLTLPLPHLSLPPTKNEKTTVDNFLKLLWVCSLPSPTLYHFEKTKNLHLLLLLYLLRLSLFFRTTLCLFFLDIRTRVECRIVLFNLIVIAEPLMYFRVCHGTPTNQNLEITNCLRENIIFRYYNLKNN